MPRVARSQPPQVQPSPPAPRRGARRRAPRRRGGRAPPGKKGVGMQNILSCAARRPTLSRGDQLLSHGGGLCGRSREDTLKATFT